MEQANLMPVADPLLADKIMDVLLQFGAFKECGGDACIRMKPFGLDDGCDWWARRV